MREASKQILRDLLRGAQVHLYRWNADDQLLENIYRTATASKCMSEVRIEVLTHGIQLEQDKHLYTRKDGTTGWYKVFRISQSYLPLANERLAQLAGIKQPINN